MTDIKIVTTVDAFKRRKTFIGIFRPIGEFWYAATNVKTQFTAVTYPIGTPAMITVELDPAKTSLNEYAIALGTRTDSIIEELLTRMSPEALAKMLSGRNSVTSQEPINELKRLAAENAKRDAQIRELEKMTVCKSLVDSVLEREPVRVSVREISDILPTGKTREMKTAKGPVAAQAPARTPAHTSAQAPKIPKLDPLPSSGNIEDMIADLLAK